MEKAEKIFQNYEQQTPKVKQISDLGVCQQYAGQKSYCDLEILNLIEKFVMIKISSIQSQIDIFDKLTVSYVNLMNKECSKTNIVSIQPDKILQNKNTINFQSFREKKKQCQIRFAKALAALNREFMCSMCSDYDKNYFQNNQFLFQQESINAFEKEATNCIQYMSQILGEEISNFTKCEQSLQNNQDLENKPQKNKISKDRLDNKYNMIIGLDGINAYSSPSIDKNIQEKVIQVMNKRRQITSSKIIQIFKSILIVILFLL